MKTRPFRLFFKTKQNKAKQTKPPHTRERHSRIVKGLCTQLECGRPRFKSLSDSELGHELGSHTAGDCPNYQAGHIPSPLLASSLSPHTMGLRNLPDENVIVTDTFPSKVSVSTNWHFLLEKNISLINSQTVLAHKHH